MGRDKATIVLDADGTTMAARAAAALTSVAEPAVEVGDGSSPLPWVREDPPGDGPLAAIGAGWAKIKAESESETEADGPSADGGVPEAALVLACDMPNVGEGLLRWLADHEAEGSVVPVVGRHPQPLCARWTAADLDAVAGRLADGERSLRGMVEGGVTLVPETDWRRAAHGAALADVDTPADLRRLCPDAPS